MKKVIIAIGFAALALVGCDRAPSNVYVLSTNDCGSHWEKLEVAATIPKHAGNPCGYNTALPNWPMAGDATFITQFDKKVKSTARISYQYSITDPVAFVNVARYLGKMGGSLEISADDAGSKYEMAENTVIDKLLREVTTDLTRTKDVVDANPAELETELFNLTAEPLAKKGITLTDLALVIENDVQTSLAIDAATALRVYDAEGIPELGKAIIVARAGATNIKVENPSK